MLPHRTWIVLFTRVPLHLSRKDSRCFARKIIAIKVRLWMNHISRGVTSTDYFDLFLNRLNLFSLRTISLLVAKHQSLVGGALVFLKKWKVSFLKSFLEWTLLILHGLEKKLFPYESTWLVDHGVFWNLLWVKFWEKTKKLGNKCMHRTIPCTVSRLNFKRKALWLHITK